MEHIHTIHVTCDMGSGALLEKCECGALRLIHPLNQGVHMGDWKDPQRSLALPHKQVYVFVSQPKVPPSFGVQISNEDDGMHLFAYQLKAGGVLQTLQRRLYPWADGAHGPTPGIWFHQESLTATPGAEPAEVRVARGGLSFHVGVEAHADGLFLTVHSGTKIMETSLYLFDQNSEDSGFSNPAGKGHPVDPEVEMIVRVVVTVGGERRIFKQGDATLPHQSEISFLAEVEGDDAKVIQFTKEWLGGANAKYAAHWLGLDFRAIKGKPV